jgi:hypothetical protein
LASIAEARKDGAITTSNTSTSVWTEADWALWWDGVENMYLAGISDEEIYWKIRLDLEAL